MPPSREIPRVWPETKETFLSFQHGMSKGEEADWCPQFPKTVDQQEEKDLGLTEPVPSCYKRSAGCHPFVSISSSLEGSQILLCRNPELISMKAVPLVTWARWHILPLGSRRGRGDMTVGAQGQPGLWGKWREGGKGGDPSCRVADLSVCDGWNPSL